MVTRRALTKREAYILLGIFVLMIVGGLSLAILVSVKAGVFCFIVLFLVFCYWPIREGDPE